MTRLLGILFILLSAGTIATAETYTVRPGDTLSGILEESYTFDEIMQIVRGIKAYNEGFVLRAGMDIEKNKNEYTIRLAVDKDLHISRENGVPNISVIQHATETLTTMVSGTIYSNLFTTALEIGEDAEFAAELARIFEWEFDFFRDIYPGDSFSALVEKKFVNGRYAGYGRILAADFVVHGKHHKAFHYDADGKTGYYDSDGKAMKRGFLRVPLSYSRISSRFTDSRLHPVLGVRRPHYGVDYAAPVGTPVMATASGTVVTRTYDSASGNYIQIRHTNGYQTSYLHLSRFNKSVYVGALVSQGQVIGYVGSTGYATGPHLDYRIRQHNRWLNPVNFIAESPKLAQEQLEPFMKVATNYNNIMKSGYQYAGFGKISLIP